MAVGISSYNKSFHAVLGKLEINIPGLEEPSYLVEQDLYKAKTFSIFNRENIKIVYKIYVSAVEDLMVIEISFEGEGELNL